MSFFPLSESLQGGVTVSKAEIVVAPRSKLEWLKLQLLNINITNLALIFTVVAVSWHINNQLSEQNRIFKNAQEATDTLRS